MSTLDYAKRMLVPYEKLRLGPNNRIFITGIEHLADSIERTRWLSPLVVHPVNDTYIIDAGERRFRAITLLRERAAKKRRPLPYNDVECQVLDAPSDLEKFQVNVAENIDRKSLRTYEHIRLCQRARDEYQLKTARDIGRILGHSEPHVRNLLRCADKLSPRVIDTLAKGADPPLATVIAWAKLPHHKQDEEIEKWIGMKKNNPETRERNKRRMMPYHRAERYLAELEVKHSSRRRAGGGHATGAALQILRYVMGIKKEKPDI